MALLSARLLVDGHRKTCGTIDRTLASWDVQVGSVSWVIDSVSLIAVLPDDFSGSQSNGPVDISIYSFVDLLFN